ncbi:DUF4145 domain-containing protein [Hyphomicrobium nitrativorans]|nr:DUF4145 domain-containing protein [Hyphomicrobium nitrativorans]
MAKIDVGTNNNPYQVGGDQKLSDNSRHISIRCPHCNENGAFNNVLHRVLTYQKGRELALTEHSVGVYQCPNSSCRGVVLIVKNLMGLLKVLPPTRLDFDRTSIPANLLTTLSEAVACHSVEAYKATALMVRRLLEEICEREGATGPNLHQRLHDLRSKVPLSEALLDGAMELKILGNDAAHIEAKEYAAIGKEEAEIAVEVAKEILKALYQHKTLIARMQKLKSAKIP